MVILRDNIVTACGEGRAEERLQNAKSMKSLGVSPDIISQVTGLTLEEIEGL